MYGRHRFPSFFLSRFEFPDILQTWRAKYYGKQPDFQLEIMGGGCEIETEEERETLRGETEKRKMLQPNRCVTLFI